jgi:hypothetical protein
VSVPEFEVNNRNKMYPLFKFALEYAIRKAKENIKDSTQNITFQSTLMMLISWVKIYLPQRKIYMPY